MMGFYCQFFFKKSGVTAKKILKSKFSIYTNGIYPKTGLKIGANRLAQLPKIGKYFSKYKKMP